VLVGRAYGERAATSRQYRGISPSDRKVRVNSNIGVVNGVSAMHVENGGKEQRSTVRCLAVNAKSGDEWRLIARQSTRQPEA
jgi:hypothetical protein